LLELLRELTGHNLYLCKDSESTTNEIQKKNIEFEILCMESFPKILENYTRRAKEIEDLKGKIFEGLDQFKADDKIKIRAEKIGNFIFGIFVLILLI